MKSWLILAATAALWLEPLLASDDAAKQQEGIKKIEQAVTHTNIFELPSFEMKASVQIATQANSPTEHINCCGTVLNVGERKSVFPVIRKCRLEGMGLSRSSAAPPSFPFAFIICTRRSVMDPVH